jgi:Fe-S oxidoreductase
MSDKTSRQAEKKNTVDLCSLCGFCKAGCPTFMATKSEAFSPRGRAILLKKGVLDKDIFNKCTLCGACEERCPAKVGLGLREAREKMVESGNETNANKLMIENVRKFGNPFGKIEKGKIPDKLYCC